MISIHKSLSESQLDHSQNNNNYNKKRAKEKQPANKIIDAMRTRAQEIHIDELMAHNKKHNTKLRTKEKKKKTGSNNNNGIQANIETHWLSGGGNDNSPNQTKKKANIRASRWSLGKHIWNVPAHGIDIGIYDSLYIR